MPDLAVCAPPSLPRRTLLQGLALTGGLALAPGMLQAALAAKAARAGGILRLEGDVRVDGKPAVPGQQIGFGQQVETGEASQVVFVSGGDAFLLRETSVLRLETRSGSPVLHYLAGKALSVFGEGRRHLETPTAAIGLRGTACYIEAAPARTYFCLCYGKALLAPKSDPNRRKSLRTRHHEHPVHADRSAGARAVLPAHMVDHEDAELVMLAALLGRRPPFLDQAD